MKGIFNSPMLRRVERHRAVKTGFTYGPLAARRIARRQIERPSPLQFVACAEIVRAFARARERSHNPLALRSSQFAPHPKKTTACTHRARRHDCPQTHPARCLATSAQRPFLNPHAPPAAPAAIAQSRDTASSATPRRESPAHPIQSASSAIPNSTGHRAQPASAGPDSPSIASAPCAGPPTASDTARPSPDTKTIPLTSPPIESISIRTPRQAPAASLPHRLGGSCGSNPPPPASSPHEKTSFAAKPIQYAPSLDRAPSRNPTRCLYSSSLRQKAPETPQSKIVPLAPSSPRRVPRDQEALAPPAAEKIPLPETVLASPSPDSARLVPPSAIATRQNRALRCPRKSAGCRTRKSRSANSKA